MIVSTILNTTLIDTPMYTSSNLSVGTYTELTLDINVTAASGDNLISIYRINPQNTPELIREIEFFTPQQISLDIGHYDLIDGTTSNLCSCVFGNTVQLQIESSETLSATVSLKGKGQ